jgi:hypothetical protein
MKNVKAISIIGMLLVTTAANAQFTAGNRFSLRDYLGLECMVTKVTPPDHSRDPEYKVNLWGKVNYRSDPPNVTEFEATHTTMSGREYPRSAQYSNASLRSNSNWIQWTGWRRGNQMVGTLYFNNGRWHYDERITRNGRLETTIETVCHDELEGD